MKDDLRLNDLDTTLDMHLLIQHINRHVYLNSSEIKFVLSCFEMASFSRKQFILNAGEICKKESFVIKGCVKIYRLDEKGVEHILNFGVEDWWVGDLYSFLEESPAMYSIQAIEDTAVLQITKAKLESLYHEVPAMERFFRILFQNAYVSQQRRIDQRLSLTAEERYHDFISRFARLEQRVTQKDLASYLGMTPVFLSILRRRSLET